VRLLAAFLLLFTPFALASESQQEITWPTTGAPILRFTFAKFKEIDSGAAGERMYAIDTTAENVSSKPIVSQRFNVYLFDKKQVRIGDAWMEVTNVGPGQTIRFQITVEASGAPVSLSVVASSDVARAISMTVNSVPQGALLKVDGVEAGLTPKIISVGAGKHELAFSKEGFLAGVFPLEIGPNDVSGGSVSYELGSAQLDTIELRDGSVLNGDLDSISGMDVVVRIGGVLQHISRNEVKRILFVQREPPPTEPLPQALPNQ
jgi:hypothetical protein